MRDYLFRGKSKTTGKWFYGVPVKTGKEVFIITKWTLYGFLREKVIPETVGQWTGEVDKYEKKIFEGDSIKFKSWPARTVVWRDKYLAGYSLGGTDLWLMGYDLQYMEIIGNVHDNPELMEGK